MSAPRKALYGTAPPPETGRKTWDKDEVLLQARERAERERESRMTRTTRAPTPPDAREIEIRRQRLNLDQDLNRVTLVPAGASAVGRRGRGAGFYCDACDLTYKDSLQWIDHLNSKQHLRATGQTETQQRASLEDVQKRLEWLRQKRDEAGLGQKYNIQQRIAERRKLEEAEREARRERRRQKRAARRRVPTRSDDDSSGGEEGESVRGAMQQMMGFAGFGSTKT
ncbi:uncharacterized protein V1518DRAFT_415663 [Limtongia smithiae]|uniref:uncharacterized protein n=1 Tax=Limtongia smithiae TaxID=1125753 RepID=UPI0034CE2324